MTQLKLNCTKKLLNNTNYKILDEVYIPNKEQLELYLNFDTIEIDGSVYFKDYGPLGLNCLAIDTSSAYDSIQLNNDIRLQIDCSAAGCFSQFYDGSIAIVGNSTKTVMLNDLSQLYLDNYIFSNVEQNIFLIYSAEQTVNNLDLILNRISIPTWVIPNFNIINEIQFDGSLGIAAISFGTTSQKAYLGAVLAPNGYIYGIPFNSTKILKINPTNDSFTEFGNLTGTSKWAGGCLAYNGKIYCIPYTETRILVINTLNDEISYIENIPVGSAKWGRGVMAINGKIYGIPYSGTNILEINPLYDTFQTFGDFGSSVQKWNTACVAPNGMIYCNPDNATSILKINPFTHEYSTFGTLASSPTHKIAGSVLAPNGMIYCVSNSYPTILKINPNDDTISTFGDLTTIPNYNPAVGIANGGSLALNGKIYWTPYSATVVIEVDPSTDTFTYFEDYIGSQKWASGIRSRNGDIYGMPGNNYSIFKITFVGDKSIPKLGVDIGMYFNKY